MTAPWYHWKGEDLVLLLHVQPKSSRDMLAGIVGDRLKIRLTAPPADGKANAHLLHYLAGAGYRATGSSCYPAMPTATSGSASLPRTSCRKSSCPRRVEAGCTAPWQ